MKSCKLRCLQMIIVLCLFFVSLSMGADLYSDTWVATDALGRQLPGYEECGPPREGKYVGVFYFIWHGEEGPAYGPYDTTQLILNNPSAPAWGGVYTWHHWGQPETEYFLAGDEWVIRRNASMLADAGVDVIIFDTSNGNAYQNQYMNLCSVYEQIRSEGGKTPQIAFLAPFGDPTTLVTSLYNNLYGPGLYEDLWFMWNGKPLIMANPAYFTGTILNFFTFRKPIASYFTGPSSPGADEWGWAEVYPQHLFNYEEVTVAVAQNAYNGVVSFMSDKRGVQGRSWHNGAKDTGAGAVNYGYNFQEQWDRALSLDPSFIFVTGWNEWVALRYLTWNGYDASTDSYYSDAMFVDAYNQEYNRDIEPMKGGHTDNYYYQLISNIRKFKGVRPPETPSPAKTITIDGQFSDWADVRPEFRDTIGDTAHRDYAGWGSLYYTNTTGRNDIIISKVAYDANNIYFYAEANDTLTSYTDPNWMLVFIDVDQNSSTGWEGYDNLIEFTSSTVCAVKYYTGDGTWTYYTSGSYMASGNKIEVTVPRGAIGQSSGQSKIGFNFHWADNISKPNILINGSFESPNVAAGNPGYEYMSPVNGPYGWFLYDYPDPKLDQCYLIDENSTILWGGAFTSAADGGQFVQIRTDTGLHQNVVLQEGVTYTLSLNYTGNAGQAGTEGFCVRTFDMVSGSPANIIDHHLYYSGINSAANPDWQHAEYSVTPSSGASSTVISFQGPGWFDANAVSYMWIDNVKLTSDDITKFFVNGDSAPNRRASYQYEVVPTDNFLSNGSFEDPNIATLQTGPPLTDWLNWGTGTFYLLDAAYYLPNVVPVPDGHQFLETDKGPDGGNSTNLAHLLVLTPGVYTVSLKYTGNAGQAGTEGVLIRTFDIVDGGAVNIVDHIYTYAGNNTLAAPDWQDAKFNMTVSEGAINSYVTIMGQSWGAPGEPHMWIDNVKVNWCLQASLPNPADSATNVNITPTLSWTVGHGASSHDVYFGTSQANVTNATHASAEYKGNQAGTTYAPGTLSNNTTYYWRIDEVVSGVTTKGTVWGFTTIKAVPTFVAAGAVTSNTTAISPPLPGGIATNDILLLFLETSNQVVTIPTPNGGTWTQVTNSPQYCGTAAGTTGARLTVFWSRYNGTQGAPTTSDSGDHQLGRMIAIRGAAASGNPWDVTAGGVEATSDTSGSIPGATTTVGNTLVVTAIATSLPDASSTANFSAWTNANLTSITERIDNSVTAGNGGGLGVATGIRAATGAYGNTTVTLANAAYKGMMSIAIKP